MAFKHPTTYPKHPTYTTHSRSHLFEKLYLSKKVLSLRYTYDQHKLIFDVLKNRCGPTTGIQDLYGAINECADILVQYKFQGYNQLFQEGMKQQLNKCYRKHNV